MAEKLTVDQKDTYVGNGGDCCPHCQSNDLDGTGVHIDSGTAWQNISCNECNAEWQDIYSLTDIVG